MMQKRILVLALAAAISAPALADTANVTVYGALDLAVGKNDNGVTSTTQVSSQVSKLGFKGAEDLGDGLSAIWQIEQQIDVDNSSAAGAKNSLATRNSFGGLKGESWGTLLMGRHDTPYKLATRKLDVFGDTLADNRSLMGQAGAHDARPTDVLAYVSPAMNGLTAAVAYVAGAEQAVASGDVKGSAWSAAAMYDAGPLYASLGYQAFNYGSAGTGQLAGTADDKMTAWKVGVGYKMDALQLNAVYEKTSSSFSGVDTKGVTDIYLAGKYSMGSDAVKLAYASAGKVGAAAAAGSDARQLSIGYDHGLSKRTTVYALYTKLSNGSAASYKITNAGSSAGGFAVAAGNDPSAWSFGIRHAF